MVFYIWGVIRLVLWLGLLGYNWRVVIWFCLKWDFFLINYLVVRFKIKLNLSFVLCVRGNGDLFSKIKILMVIKILRSLVWNYNYVV